MASTDISLKVLTLNVQGLRKTKVRRALFRSFKSLDVDVIALQETYLIDSDYDTIQSEWNGTFHLSPGTNQRKGLLTLFNKSLLHFESKIVFKTDRILTSLLKIDNKDNNKNNVLITNIYIVQLILYKID